MIRKNFSCTRTSISTQLFAFPFFFSCHSFWCKPFYPPVFRRNVRRTRTKSRAAMSSFPKVRIYRPTTREFHFIPASDFSSGLLIRGCLERAAAAFGIDRPCVLRLRSTTGSVFTLPTDDRLCVVDLCGALAVVPHSPEVLGQLDAGPYLELFEPAPGADPQEGRMLLRIPVFDSQSKQLTFVARVDVGVCPGFFDAARAGGADRTQAGFVGKVVRAVARLFSAGSTFALFDAAGRRLPHAGGGGAGCAPLIGAIFRGEVFFQAVWAQADRQASHARLPIFERLLEIEASFLRDVSRLLGLPGAPSPLDPATLRSLVKPAQIAEFERLLRAAHRRHAAFLQAMRESARFDFYFPLGECLYAHCEGIGEDTDLLCFCTESVAVRDRRVSHWNFAKGDKDERMAVYTAVSRICMICELYRRQIVLAVAATPPLHPDYRWVRRCETAVNGAMRRLHEAKSAAEAVFVPWLPGEVAEAAFVMQCNGARYRLALLPSALLLGDETAEAASVAGVALDTVGLAAFGAYSVLLRHHGGQQLFSLESRRERDRLLAEYRARARPWPGELRVEAWNLNWRLRAHTLAAGDGALFAFGGVDDDTDPGGFLRFEFPDGVPRAIPVQSACPPARRHAAMVGTKDGILLFGGKGADGSPLGDLACFHGAWAAVQSQGDDAPPGWGYDLAAWPEREALEVLLTGGRDSLLFCRGALTTGDPPSISWTAIRPQSPMPGLSGHRAFLLGPGYGVIVGGKTADKRPNTHVFLFEGWGARVTQLACTGLAPFPRKRAAFARIGGVVFCVGGKPDFDCHALDLATLRWHPVHGDWAQFCGAAACAGDDVAYVMGGIDRTFVFQSKLLRLSLTEESTRPVPSLEALRDFAVEDTSEVTKEWQWQTTLSWQPGMRPIGRDKRGPLGS
jgi:hypothetical protein